MTTDKEIKDALATICTATATALGENVRVVKRWKLSLKGKEPLSALADLADNKKINGLYIARVKRTSKKIGANHWEYEWKYAMFYFRSYSDVPASGGEHSEDKANEYIEALAAALEESPGLGIDDGHVDEHTELQTENIDTIDLRVHAFQNFITIKLTNQG